ncbi:MAG TPA: hypothetical protein PKB03_05370 [Baekduia sp.]|nr:hypothetical protein [Baekduia sp.]
MILVPAHLEMLMSRAAQDLNDPPTPHEPAGERANLDPVPDVPTALSMLRGHSRH